MVVRSHTFNILQVIASKFQAKVVEKQRQALENTKATIAKNSVKRYLNKLNSLYNYRSIPEIEKQKFVEMRLK